MNELGISKVVTYTLRSKEFQRPETNVFDLKHSILDYYKLDLLIENRFIPEVRHVLSASDVHWLRGLFLLLTIHVKTCRLLCTEEFPFQVTPIYKRLIVEAMGDSDSRFILSDDLRVD